MPGECKSNKLLADEQVIIKSRPDREDLQGSAQEIVHTAKSFIGGVFQ